LNINEISEPVAYSLRFVNTQTGSEQVLLESNQECFMARVWKNSHTVVVERHGANQAQTLIEYDLNSNSVISESTATPRP